MSGTDAASAAAAPASVASPPRPLPATGRAGRNRSRAPSVRLPLLRLGADGAAVGGIGLSVQAATSNAVVRADHEARVRMWYLREVGAERSDTLSARVARRQAASPRYKC